MPADFGSLRGFLRAAKGLSQERIIVEFLAATVLNDPISDQGSVLINHPRGKKLIVFNEGNFLFKKKILDPRARASWPTEFDYFEGIAGKCFREGQTQTFCRGDEKCGPANDFFGDSPIQNMVCVPIITTPGTPFGVVCFHNNSEAKRYKQEEKETLEAYVDVLAIALHNPLPELHLENNVFIVHGRDMRALDELQLILLHHKVTPRVLLREDKGPNSILEELEALIRVCKAGFILATPDDEGRLQATDDPLVGRARENVIFETGLLFAKYREFERVTLLVKKPLQLPSDLNGIAYEEFDSVKAIEMTIVNKLTKWGLRDSK